MLDAKLVVMLVVLRAVKMVCMLADKKVAEMAGY